MKFVNQTNFLMEERHNTIRNLLESYQEIKQKSHFDHQAILLTIDQQNLLSLRFFKISTNHQRLQKKNKYVS